MYNVCLFGAYQETPPGVDALHLYKKGKGGPAVNKRKYKIKQYCGSGI
jgi:hypothetical protein